MRLLALQVFLLFSISSHAQEKMLPYHEIPDYPSEYNACTVTARMLDGLGFRYYWATEGLRAEDLSYRPGEDARTTSETLEHIQGLTSVVLNAVKQQPTIRSSTAEELTFEQRRKQTLLNIKEASDILKVSEDEDMAKFDIVFQRGDQSNAFPFWNNLNGPLADALWHVGQVVSFRRSSGNPLNPKVSVFQGRLRE
jgi:hypothetical protein